MQEYSEFFRRKQPKYSANILLGIQKRILKSTLIYGDKWNNANVCEIGSGRGSGYLAAKKLNLVNYLGVEPVPNPIQDYPIIAESLPKLQSIKNESFELVYSFHVLEHASGHSEALSWITEMKRILKVNGILLVSCPDIRDYRNFFWDCDWTHGYPVTPNRLRQLCDALDLEVLELTTYYFGLNSKVFILLVSFIRMFFPTKLLDIICGFFGLRPYASNFSMLIFWGEATVVARKKK